MKLYVDTDVAYLVAPKAKRYIPDYFYCSNNSTTTPHTPLLNGPLYVECKVLCHITSAPKAEMASLFYNCKMALYLQRMLTVLCRPQTIPTSKWTIEQQCHLLKIQ